MRGQRPSLLRLHESVGELTHYHVITVSRLLRCPDVSGLFRCLARRLLRSLADVDLTALQRLVVDQRHKALLVHAEVLRNDV